MYLKVFFSVLVFFVYFLFLHCSSVQKCCSLGISVLFGLKFLTDQGIQKNETSNKKTTTTSSVDRPQIGT